MHMGIMIRMHYRNRAYQAAFPPDFDFAVGTQVEGTSPTGQPFLAKIKSFANDEVTLDVNHPLAGEDLTFEVELEIQNTEDWTIHG